MDKNDRRKHINALMDTISTYLDTGIKGKSDQVQVLLDIIIESYAMLNYHVRTSFEEPQEGIDFLMQDLRNGFIAKNQEILDALKKEVKE